MNSVLYVELLVSSVSTVDPTCLTRNYLRSGSILYTPQNSPELSCHVKSIGSLRIQVVAFC